MAKLQLREEQAAQTQETVWELESTIAKLRGEVEAARLNSDRLVQLEEQVHSYLNLFC